METRETIPAKMRELAGEGVACAPGPPRAALGADPEWRKLRATGTRLWLDTGDLDEARKLYTADFEALTTNNTLLNHEVQKGIYDDLIRRAAAVLRAADAALPDRELVLEIAFVLNARHALTLAHEFGALVSVELHTDLAHDVDRSVDYGRRFHALCPQRFIIKIPLTPAGFLAARRLSQSGIPVNFTLGFSARQNYLAALLARPAFVNVFMGRLGAFLADNHLGSGSLIGEKATLAAQRELDELRRQGRSRTQLIGASMRTGAQVGALAGLDIFTMPPKVAADYRLHPLDRVSSRMGEDPDVPLAEGVRLEDFGGASLWEVSDAFKECVELLLEKDGERLSPQDLQQHFHVAGLGDFLPAWSPDEIATVMKEGKIPVYATWKERLATGQIGLDALMNLAALCAFVTDQTALDNRIRSLV